MECHSQMLSAEINLSVKIKIEINVFVAEKPFIGEFFLSEKILAIEKLRNFIHKFVTFPQILD